MNIQIRLISILVKMGPLMVGYICPRIEEAAREWAYWESTNCPLKL